MARPASFMEGDIVAARRPLMLLSPAQAQVAVPRGALLLLGPPVERAEGPAFWARVLGLKPAAGVVPAEALTESPGFGEFEPALSKYLPEFAKSLSARMGERGVRQLVRLGIERSRGAGLTEASGLYLYTEIMMELGVDFHDDPFLPWAAPVLSGSPPDAATPAASRRVYDLSAAVGDYLDRVVGADQARLRKALRRAVNLRLGDLPSAGAGFADRMRLFFMRVYPERMANAAPDAVERLSRALPAERAAGDKGPAVSLAVLFSLGHGAFGDPRVPELRGAARPPEAAFAILHDHLENELRHFD